MTAKTGQVSIRDACVADLPRLVAIYNHYVETSHVTFDSEPFSVDQRRHWLHGFATSGRYRLLVADIGDNVVGYASSQRLRPKPAYDCSVETTVYIAPGYERRGIGAALYQALLNSLRGTDVHQAFAGIALPNRPSVALHERLGFRFVGSFPQAGLKFGRYWDIGWYVCQLDRDPD